MNKVKISFVSFLFFFATGCAIKVPLTKSADGAVSASAMSLTSGLEGSWEILSLSQRAINPVTGEYDGEYSSKVLAVPKNALLGEVIKGAVAAGGQIGSAVLLPGVRNRSYSNSNFAPNFDVSPTSQSIAGSESGLNNSVNSSIVLD